MSRAVKLVVFSLSYSKTGTAIWNQTIQQLACWQYLRKASSKNPIVVVEIPGKKILDVKGGESQLLSRLGKVMQLPE